MRETLGQLFGTPPVRLIPGARGDALVLSMRRIYNLPAYSARYEFEDVIAQLLGADQIEPQSLGMVNLTRRIYKGLYRAGAPAGLAMSLTPPLGGLRLTKQYDLFIAIFNHTHEVAALSAVPNWRQHCKRAICLIAEAWEQDDLNDYLLKTLKGFDCIYLSTNPVETVARLSGLRTRYLPNYADALALCPYPNPPKRNIDVLGIGRRSAITHAALLKLARDQGLFYYYDTVNSGTNPVMDATEHRFKFVSLAKRSRYYMASKARADEPKRAAVDEISGRFYEGAATGTIMIGDAPKTGHYLKLFDWPDAVVQAPFDDPAIGELLAELDAKPERCNEIRRNNMVNALLRHDCGYRLRTLLEDADLPLPKALLAREQRLRALADLVQKEPVLA